MKKQTNRKFIELCDSWSLILISNAYLGTSYVVKLCLLSPWWCFVFVCVTLFYICIYLSLWKRYLWWTLIKHYIFSLPPVFLRWLSVCYNDKKNKLLFQFMKYKKNLYVNLSSIHKTLFFQCIYRQAIILNMMSITHFHIAFFIQLRWD